jgi:hypothetical protein
VLGITLGGGHFPDIGKRRKAEKIVEAIKGY